MNITSKPIESRNGKLTLEQILKKPGVYIPDKAPDADEYDDGENIRIITNLNLNLWINLSTDHVEILSKSTWEHYTFSPVAEEITISFVN